MLSNLNNSRGAQLRGPAQPVGDGGATPAPEDDADRVVLTIHPKRPVNRDLTLHVQPPTALESTEAHIAPNAKALTFGAVAATAGGLIGAGGATLAALTLSVPVAGPLVAVPAVLAAVAGGSAGAVAFGGLGASFAEPAGPASDQREPIPHHARFLDMAAHSGALEREGNMELAKLYAEQALDGAARAAGLIVGSPPQVDAHLTELMVMVGKWRGGRSEAWVNRTVATAICHGVFSAADIEKDGKVVRYGANTLYNEGIKRDYARNVGASCVNYTKSFGLASVAGGVVKDSSLAAPESVALQWGATGAIIGAGQEGTLVSGLGGHRYTANPTADQKKEAGVQRSNGHSFWAFGVLHGAMDLGLVLGKLDWFNPGAARLFSGGAAAAVTGWQRTRITMQAANMAPGWLDGDNARMGELIDDLQDSTFIGLGGWLEKLASNVVSSPMTDSASVMAKRALARAFFASVMFAPRFLASDALFGKWLTSQSDPEGADWGKLGAFGVTDVGLAAWGAVNNYLNKRWPTTPPAGATHPELTNDWMPPPDEMV